MAHRFQFRPQAGEGGMIGAKAFELCRRNLLGPQPAVFLPQASHFGGIDLRVFERQPVLHRLSPLGEQGGPSGNR